MQNPSEGTSRSVAEEASGSLGYLPGVGGLGPGFEGGGTVEPAVPVLGTHPAGVPENASVSLRKALIYSSGNFGSGLYWALNSFILPLLFLSLHIEPVLNNLLSSTRSVEGTIVQPIVGAWSDRTWKGWLGRRRYFIVLFAPLSAFFVALTPFAAQAGGFGHFIGLNENTTASVLVVATVILFTFTFNVMYDPYNALLADITPERQRGRVNGIFQATSGLGQVVILITTLILILVFGTGHVPLVPVCLVVTAVLLLSFLVTVVGIREPQRIPGAIRHERYTWREYWDGLRRDGQVMLYFANQFLLWFGISAVQFNLIYYSSIQLHLDAFGGIALAAILLITTAVSVGPLGLLSDRIGLKAVYVLGVVLMSSAGIAGTFITDHILIGIILAVAGIGNGAQTASSYPLLTRLVFPEEMGLYTGLSSSISSVAGPAAAIISGLVVGTLESPHFERLWPFVAGLFVLSLLPLAVLRIDKSRLARARAEQAAARAA